MAMPRYLRRTLLVTVDAAAVATAFLFAYLLGGGFRPGLDAKDYIPQFYALVPFLVVARLILFALFGLYRGIIRYASFHELKSIFLATILGSLILVAYNYVTPESGQPMFVVTRTTGDTVEVPWFVPRSVIAIEAMLTFLAVSGLRFSRRLLIITGLLGARTGRRILVIGMGPSAERVIREFEYNPEIEYRVVAVIDTDKLHTGSRLHGVPILGGIEAIQNAVEYYDVDEILIALPGAAPALLRRIVEECEKTRVAFKRLPSLTDLMSGKVTISDLRPVELEDLLGRPAVELRLDDEQNYLRDETVLITGAGGSIGSELCRQILHYGPARLILVGRGENSIYEIATELGYRFDDHRLELVIADIRNERRMTRVFEQYRPTIVYHAAAHKHVPLMELAPEEAVTNNILGTRLVAQLAARFGTRLFIMISTDKAVRPTNIMGASKRVAEMLVRAIGGNSATKFLVVRFGNVLGSRGSVVPLFKRQIEAGGPVTITHPEATRYCMTIPEAVSLVIQTGALREKGSLFLLDMGQPVKVLDLARNLITLSGLEPDVDIQIQVIGLRPGEKLYEELLTKEEGVQATEIGKIFVTHPDAVETAFLHEQVETLTRAAEQSDTETIRKVLEQLVPDYRPANVPPKPVMST
jgi:FlaA1/EpsC-like NDP-sugar epimerase